MTTKNIVPRSNNEGELGTSNKQWDKVHAKEIYENDIRVATANNVPPSIGSNTIPTYTNANGVLTASNASVGDANTPVYMDGGEIKSTGKSFSSYLPLAGGTMTGAITLSTSNALKRDIDNGTLTIFGASAQENGSYLLLSGKDNTSFNGMFSLNARSGGTNKALQGKIDGSLTWDGNNVLTADNYSSYALPLNGGTMTGTITLDDGGNPLSTAGGTMTGSVIRSGNFVKNANNTSTVSFWGGADNTSALISLYGKSHSTTPGRFEIKATDGTNTNYLIGRPDGTLTWDGQAIQTSSDKRLKTDFADIPNDVLEAWGKINWQQFKYKADVERKGAENCRWHTGLVAQDVVEVGEENEVDFLKYGILCHDVRDAVEEEKDDDGNVIQEAREAVDLWTVRYTEALCMEVAYLRKKIAELEARLGAE